VLKLLYTFLGAGLKELSITDCDSVTPDGILSCVKLPFLRHFKYVALSRVSKSFVLQICSQNPSLESIAVNCSGSTSEVAKEVKVNNPRLTKLRTTIDLVSFRNASSPFFDALISIMETHALIIIIAERQGQ